MSTKKMNDERKKAIEKISSKMLKGRDSHVMTMFRIPEETEAKFRVYCTNNVNNIDSQHINAGYKILDRRGKRSDGKGPTFFAFMELMSAGRDELPPQEKKTVEEFEKLLLELMSDYRFNRDFIKAD